MILVTGTSGLIGQHLVKTLSADQKIKACFRKQKPEFYTSINESNIEWVECDITDTPSLELAFNDVTHVYHCAALVSYDPRLKNELMRVNIEGTANIVNLCLDYSIKKLCYVSSIATLGNSAFDQLISEKDDWEETNENSQYAISKQGAEMEVWRGIAEGLNAVIINPGIILGEGDIHKSSTTLFKIVQDEFPFYTKGKTAWADVEDVVKIMIQLMNSDIKNERFIVSAGNYSFLEIFTLMANAMNKKPPHKLASSFITECVWRFESVKHFFTNKQATITKETARNANSIRCYDNSKLLSALSGYDYTPIQQTIDRICKTI